MMFVCVRLPIQGELGARSVSAATRSAAIRRQTRLERPVFHVESIHFTSTTARQFWYVLSKYAECVCAACSAAACLFACLSYFEVAACVWLLHFRFRLPYARKVGLRAVEKWTERGNRCVPSDCLHGTGLLLPAVAPEFVPLQRICRGYAHQQTNLEEGMMVRSVRRCCLCWLVVVAGR